MIVDQQLCSWNLPHSLVDCGRLGPLIVVAQKRQPELRVPSAGRFYVKSPGVVGVKWVTVSASITGKSLLRFVARSYVFGLCRAVSFVQIQTAMGITVQPENAAAGWLPMRFRSRPQSLPVYLLWPIG